MLRIVAACCSMATFLARRVVMIGLVGLILIDPVLASAAPKPTAGAPDYPYRIVANNHDFVTALRTYWNKGFAKPQQISSIAIDTLWFNGCITNRRYVSYVDPYVRSMSPSTVTLKLIRIAPKWANVVSAVEKSKIRGGLSVAYLLLSIKYVDPGQSNLFNEFNSEMVPSYGFWKKYAREKKWITKNKILLRPKSQIVRYVALQLYLSPLTKMNNTLQRKLWANNIIKIGPNYYMILIESFGWCGDYIQKYLDKPSAVLYAYVNQYAAEIPVAGTTPSRKGHPVYCP